MRLREDARQARRPPPSWSVPGYRRRGRTAEGRETHDRMSTIPSPGAAACVRWPRGMLPEPHRATGAVGITRSPAWREELWSPQWYCFCANAGARCRSRYASAYAHRPPLRGCCCRSLPRHARRHRPALERRVAPLDRLHRGAKAPPKAPPEKAPPESNQRRARRARALRRNSGGGGQPARREQRTRAIRRVSAVRARGGSPAPRTPLRGMRGRNRYRTTKD
jgi:hypothetical protein